MKKLLILLVALLTVSFALPLLPLRGQEESAQAAPQDRAGRQHVSRLPRQHGSVGR